MRRVDKRPKSRSAGGTGNYPHGRLVCGATQKRAEFEMCSTANYIFEATTRQAYLGRYSA